MRLFVRRGQGQQASKEVSCHESRHSIHLHKCFILVRVVAAPEAYPRTTEHEVGIHPVLNARHFSAEYVHVYCGGHKVIQVNYNAFVTEGVVSYLLLHLSKKKKKKKKKGLSSAHSASSHHITTYIPEKLVS